MASRVQNQDHERRVRHALPLARETVQGGALEAEARIVLRVADHDNERTAAIAQDLETAPHELGADALPLVVGQNRQGRQSHPDDWPSRALDRPPA